MRSQARRTSRSSSLGRSMCHAIMPNIRSACIAAACMLGAATLTPHAVAQDSSEWQFSGFNATDDRGGWGFSSPRPPFTRSMLTRAFDRLNLEPDQREVAQSVYDAFEQEYLSIWLQHTESSSDARMHQMMTQDWQAMQEEMETSQRQYRQKMKQLLDAFMLDFELMLSPEQTEIWERIDLDKKRSEYLALATDGRYRPVDLATVIDGLDLDESTKASLAPIIERYHTDIDAALVPALRQAERVLALGQEHQTAQREMMELHQSEDRDMEAIQRLQAEQVSKGESARDAALDLRRMYGQVLTVQRRALEEIQRELPSRYHEDYEKATIQRDNSQGFSLAGYSRFNIAAQTLDNLEQTRAMMDMQMAMMSDNMDEEQSAMFREMALMMRRAKPLSRDQKRTLERIKAEHKQTLEELEASARRRATEAMEDEESYYMQVRVPGGTITLYRHDEDGNRRGWPRPNNEVDQEIQRKRAEAEQDAITQLREILDFYQRALIANY